MEMVGCSLTFPDRHSRVRGNPGCMTVRMNLDTRFRGYDGIGAVALSFFDRLQGQFKRKQRARRKNSINHFSELRVLRVSVVKTRASEKLI
jgi:hypothetical protein